MRQIGGVLRNRMIVCATVCLPSPLKRNIRNMCNMP